MCAGKFPEAAQDYPRCRGPSTSELLRIREAVPSLRMTGYERSDPYSLLDCGGFGAEFVEGGFEIGGNGRSFAGFDVAARHHVNELTVAEDCNRGRGRGLAGEITAGAFGGLRVLSREYGKGRAGGKAFWSGHADGGGQRAA